MTDRQFDKRLSELEKQVGRQEKTMREITDALVTISTSFMALTQLLSAFTRKPPDDPSKIRVTLN